MMFSSKNNLGVFFLLVISLVLLPFIVLATEKINAGFVTGLWYSKHVFFAGDQVRIYSAVQNQSEYDLSGTIQFIDNDKVIGKKDFSAVSGRLIEEWIDWQVTAGAHNIYVQITDAKKNTIGQKPQSVELSFASSQADNKVIDFDTDKDKIGDKIDTDDDGDGLTDQEEKEIGTDPLKKDTDGDGAGDQQEIERGSDPLKADNSSFNSEKFSLNEVVKEDKKSTSSVSSTESLEEEIVKTESIKKTVGNFYNNFFSTSKKLSDELSRIKDAIKSKAEITANSSSSTPQNNQESISLANSVLLVLINIAIFILYNKIVLIILLLTFVFLLWKLVRSIIGKI